MPGPRKCGGAQLSLAGLFPMRRGAKAALAGFKPVPHFTNVLAASPIRVRILTWAEAAEAAREGERPSSAVHLGE